MLKLEKEELTEEIKNKNAQISEFSEDVFLDFSNKKQLSRKEFALLAAENIKELKKESVFYNTFAIEALNLLKEV